MRCLHVVLLLSMAWALTGGWAPPAAAETAPAAEPAPAERIVIAVAEFEARDKEIGKAVSQTVFTDLVRSKWVRLVERSRLAQILAELKVENSGLVDPKTASKIGELLGAKKLITGDVTRVGDRVALHACLVNVQTGEVETGQATQVEGGGGDNADFYGLAHTLSDQIHYAITHQWLPGSEEHLGIPDPHPQSQIKLDVQIDRKPGSTYFWNETMEVSVRADKACYVYLYNIDTMRAVSQLYPNEFEPEKRLQPNVWYRFPPPNAAYMLHIEGETGPEDIIAIASLTPLDMDGAARAKLGDVVSENASEWVGRRVVPRLKADPAGSQVQRVHFYTARRRE